MAIIDACRRQLAMTSIATVLLLLCCVTIHGFQLPTSRVSFSSLFAIKPVIKTEEEWKAELLPDEYYVLREEGTEAPFSSELNNVKDPGTFICSGCGAPLFTTSTKFDSGTGWPSFYAPLDSEAVALSTDFKLIMPRTECRCAACGGHLGHVFDDGPQPTGQRYCMNGVSMKFEPNTENPDLAAQVAERQAAAPEFKPTVGQILPGALFNGLIGAVCFNAFLSRLDQATQAGVSLSSPLDFWPLVPALLFGIMAGRSISRLL